MDSIKKIYKGDIPAIVFTLDDTYVPYFSVALAGIAINGLKNKTYDIVVLSTDISEQNKEKLSDFITKFPNISLRFYDIEKIIEKEKQYMKSNIEHINEVAFYRLFIPSIFKEYKKVIFLDCDICVDGDIAELYNIDLKDNYIAAAKGMFSISHEHNIRISLDRYKAAQYMHEVLSIPVKDYFNAGVLVFNIKQILQDGKQDEFISKISEAHKFKYNDQDILNICCHNRVKFLGVEWNFLRKFKDKNSVLVYDSMLTSKIKIYHYVGNNKPWLKHDRLFYNVWYMYAILSPFKDFLFSDIDKE